MKKNYFLFIVFMFLICNNSYAVIMPVDSAQNTATLPTVQSSQGKLPFFKRLIFNKLMKKLNNRNQENKPLNKIGLAGFIMTVTGVFVLLFSLDSIIVISLIVIALGTVFNIISFFLNKEKRNPFGILGIIFSGLTLLAGLILLIILSGF